ncbi:MAG: hypothetical protein K2Q06_10205, partial [Parvularculaceae bacterium]|nr:hypothetical protein [Parvularculaceae bacterium]
MLRSVIGVVVGIVVGAALVFVMERIGHVVYPTPAGFDFKDPEQLKLLVAATPLGAKLFVVAGWFLASFVGGLVALRVARNWAPTAWIVAIAFLGLTAMNFAAIPHPLWMVIAGVIVCLGGGYLAIRISGA